MRLDRLLLRAIALLVGLMGLLTGISGVGGLTETVIPIEKKYIFDFYVLALMSIFCLSIVVALRYLFRASNLALMRVIERRRDLSLTSCTLGHIEQISELAETHFGRLSTDSLQTRRLHEIDDTMFTAVIDGAGRLRGYFCLVKLSKLGVDAIERRDFSIINLPADYVRNSRKSRYNAIYIGAIVASDYRAEAYVLIALNVKIVEIRPTKIFARAASSDGLRLLVKYKFTPVAGEKLEIGSLFVRKNH